MILYIRRCPYRVLSYYNRFERQPKIDGLRELNDPRIIILEGEYLGDFKVFTDEIMPNFHELSIEEKVSNTLRKIYSVKEGGDGDA